MEASAFSSLPEPSSTRVRSVTFDVRAEDAGDPFASVAC